MKDVNGKEIRPGQRVRWSQVIEAEIESLGVTRPGVYIKGAFYTLEADGVTIEVLAEPRIPEPKGLGAVVEAATEDDGKRFPFILNEGVVRTCNWLSPRRGWARWDDLIDPVLLSEGWTDGDF